MKQKRIVLVAAIMLVVLGALPADADFFVIGAGGKAGTQITSLPYTINSPGLYCLSKSLTYSATTGNAITVNISDVTLDLMGFSLTGPGKYSGTVIHGIFIASGLSNVEIRNGSINNFPLMGIEGGTINGVRLIGLRVMDNGSNGIHLGGDNHVIMGCSLLSNLGRGAYLTSSSLIKDNVASGNGIIGLYAGECSTISGNVCRGNGNDGIFACGGCSVLDNTVQSNARYGIYASEGSTVMRNTSRANADVGISASSDCVIKNNTTQGLTKGVNCTLVDNTNY